MGGADLHVQVGVADGVADLLISTTGGEHGEGGGKGHQTHGGQTSRCADHVGFGDAAVEEAVGVGFLENIRLGGPCQVGVQHHQVGHFPA